MECPVEKGTFLIASPSLRDPNFRRSVVLMCEHGPEGSLGLVINRPSPLTVPEVLDELPGSNSWADMKIHVGGPVQQNHLLVLHRTERDIEGAQTICDDVQLGGENPALVENLLLQSYGEGDFRLYMGYAGWGAKQLDRELDEDAWIVCPAACEWVFDTEPEKVWPDLLRSLGGHYALMADIPSNPEFN